MDKSKLGDRMKQYERVTQTNLIRRMPVIVRLDGKAFHTYTKGLDRPFDLDMMKAMSQTMKYCCDNMQGAVFGYTQSDEISILLKDWQTLETDPWFGNNYTKIVSVSASMATASFNQAHVHPTSDRLALFDSRAFNISPTEVVNYFLWRQQDATRNSIQSYARKFFSNKELHGISNNDVQYKLLTEKDVNWNDLDVWKKRGICYVNGELDWDSPIFSEDRNYIESVL